MPTLAELLGEVVGIISLSEFWNAEMWEVATILDSHYTRQEREYRDKWEGIRILAFYSAVDKVKAKTLTDFMPFNWDKKTRKNHVLTEADRIIIAAMDKGGKSRELNSGDYKKLGITQRIHK